MTVLRGDLKISSAPNLPAYFDAVMASGYLAVVLDLTELDLVGRAGSGVIAHGASRLVVSGGELTLRAPSAMRTRALDVTWLGELVRLLPWVDVATGSLGQGLPDAVGVCLAGRYLDRLPYHAWVLCGDSETAEGSIWEALDKASYYQLGNLTAIVDVNRLGQRRPTELEWDLDRYARRAEAFGARPLVIDGHDLAAIDAALSEARSGPDHPSVILARTVKAKGVPDLEDKNGWHGQALPPDMAARAIAALGGRTDLHIHTALPQPGSAAITPAPDASITLPGYQLGEKVATGVALGAGVAALAARPEVVVLDGEVGNSTHADDFAKVAPDRYFEMFIAEQQLVASATGLAVRGYRPFASTFAVFFSRAFDFIRMAGISGVNIGSVGSHAGVEIGQDGPSQMALEDIAALRAVHGSVVLYPADATSTVALVDQMARMDGIVYLRTTRGAYPVLYPPGEPFAVGGSKVHRAGPNDQLALIGAGVTLHECLAAAAELAGSGIAARVIDLYSVKPLDAAALLDACEVTGSRLVIVEDHYQAGGIGGAVLEALAEAGVPDLRVAHLAVDDLPGSGAPAELLDAARISARHIVTAARRLTGTARCERPRVIVVGGGFAGINAAHALARSEADVILVDRHNYHTFQPLLYQVSTGYLPPEEVGAALRSVFRRQANLTVRVAVVVSVDWKDRRLSLQDDTALDFDYLVLAAGAETNYFGIVGMAEHAWPLYTLADAVALRAHLLGTLEQVAPTGRPADAEITTVVVGGGPTGVETAGALASMAHEVVGPVATLRVVLVEAGPRLLSAFNPRSSERALQDLRRRSVDVRLRRTVQAADAGGVTLDGGERIQSSTVIWAAGVQANGLGRTLGLDLSRGRVVVDPYLQVPDHPNVFVAGDLAAVAAPQPGALLPMLAPVAIQAGRHAGEQVARLVAGEPLARFRYHDKGMMAVLGRGDAVAELPLLLGAGTSRRYRLRFGGLPAWLLWVGVHIAYLICFSNRVKVLVDWGWSYFTSRGAGAILVRLPAEPQVLGLPPDGAGGRIDATSSSNGGDGQRDPSMKRPGHDDN